MEAQVICYACSDRCIDAHMDSAPILLVRGELESIDCPGVNRTYTGVEQSYEILLLDGLATRGTDRFVPQRFMDTRLPKGMPTLRDHHTMNTLPK